VNPSNKSSTSSPDLQQLDALTGGAFTAPTSGERAARLREWLASEPSDERMADVFREMSHRDKGAAKVLKEKLDDIKRAKAQDAIAAEWATRAQALLAQQRLHLADAMAWQRDAAKAGAPLSREPLAGLKQALAERMKTIEDLQHRVQVEREAAVLLTQRIEVLSTKSWQEAQAALAALQTDVTDWLSRTAALPQEPEWQGVEPKFPNQLESSRLQLGLVWDAFQQALSMAVAAASDAQAPLPAVPVWADELRLARGEAVPAPAPDPAESAARRAQAQEVVTAALEALTRELAEGHVKAAPKVAGQLRQLLKDHGRYIAPELEHEVQAAIAKTGELEGWQRWRADQLREELLAKAVALVQAPEGQRLGGRKMQETLRQLREQWKAIDQGGAPNHALWKKFDEACNEAYKHVEAWLTQLKQQNEAHRQQRLSLIEALQAWTQAHAASTDWKQQVRDLHGFSERWRQSGHLSEKMFAELQSRWKEAMAQAHTRLEAAQAESVARRQALIEAAAQLGQAPMLRIDAVKALQQQWQQEAHAVPLDRRQEQKLWEAFRQPIDEAFARKSASRERVAEALSAHDRAVMEAVQALDAATAAGDVPRIRDAMAHLQAVLRAEPSAAVADALAAAPAEDAAAPPAADEAPAAPAATQSPARKLVAMRGDDRPGMQKTTPAVPGRPGAPAGRGAPRDGGPRAFAGQPRLAERAEREPRGPRLGDTAFRAQRQALEQAELALRKLASQAHGEALVQLMTAWEQRQPDLLPAAQALGGKAVASARAAWSAAIAATPRADATQVAEALLRLEMAAEVPTPAAHLEARRALQLRLLTRRHDPAPAQTWAQDAASVLAAGHDPEAARRLLAVLKVLLRR
jgi:ATP-dependent RNA helicase SUPV3L1/SUV3